MATNYWNKQLPITMNWNEQQNSDIKLEIKLAALNLKSETSSMYSLNEPNKLIK